MDLGPKSTAAGAKVKLGIGMPPPSNSVAIFWLLHTTSFNYPRTTKSSQTLQRNHWFQIHCSVRGDAEEGGRGETANL